MSEETIVPVNPLDDDRIADLYFNENLDTPARRAAQENVGRYFEYLAGGKEVQVSQGATASLDTAAFERRLKLADRLVPEEVLEEERGPVSEQSEEPQQPYNLHEELSKELDYQPVVPELVAEYHPKMVESIRSVGGDADKMDDWIVFARAMGEDQAAEAMVEAMSFETDHPTWRTDKALFARVKQLNNIINKAYLRITSKI